MTNNPYPNRPLRYLAAFCAASFLLFRGEPFVLTPRFYFAFLASFIIGLIMVNAVHLIAVWFDGVDILKNSFLVRAMGQLVIGIAAPAILDLALISIYFIFYKENIITNGFLWRDFPFIMLMLLILNVFYLAYNLFIKKMRKLEGAKPLPDHEKHDEIEKDINSLIVRFQNTQVRLSINQFLFVYRHERKSHILKMTGKDYPCQYTIAELAQILNKYGFAQANRSTIINLKAVKGYRHGERKHTLDLIFNDDFKTFLSGFPASDFTVTKDYNEPFQKQFLTFQEEN